ncbi:MAG: metallophosphoesterase [Actinobacteria bacterium]|nr:metallophosphoesterase [Actinomycetota bacterium]
MTNRQMMQAGARRPAAPFTLVVSDVHGYPELLENALRGSGFREGIDRLVFAGDFLDRGSLARECLQRLDELGAEALIGNHDQAIALGYWIGEQQEANKVFREPLLERLRTRRLNLVTSVDGVLISHAGLTRVFAADFRELGRDPARLAARLNREHHAAVGRQLAHGRELPEPRILDEWSPQRLRVDDADVGPGRLLDGVEQIAGHTTSTVFRRWTTAMFRAAGLHAIDPGTYGLGPGDHPRHYRYAVIQGGVVRVEGGTMEVGTMEAGTSEETR